MPPSQQPPAPPPFPIPPAKSENYDFILNPPKKKRAFFLLGVNSPKQRLLVIFSIGGAILIIFILFINIAFGGENDSAQLTSLAQSQAEIIRVSVIGITKATGDSAKNLAITTKLTMETDENLTLAQLKKLGHNVGSKQLALKMNPNTDQQLDVAAANNNFDQAFIQTTQNSLVNYRSEVKKIYNASTSKSEKQLLAASYDGAGILANENVQSN